MNELTVLLVGSEALRQQLTLLLEREGYGVAYASSGREAVNHPNASIAVVIVEHGGECEIDGYTLAHAFAEHQHLGYVPTLVVTDDADPPTNLTTLPRSRVAQTVASAVQNALDERAVMAVT